MIGAVLKILIDTAGAVKIVEASQKIAHWLTGKAQLNSDIEAANELLGIRHDHDVAYRHDSVHPLYTRSTALHPDNLAALKSAAGTYFYSAAHTGHLRTTETVVSTLNTSLVLIGSPTAEGLSRPLFGYEPDIDFDSLTLRNPPLDLPYRWILSKTEIDERAQIRRYIEGKGDVLRPNWRIVGKNEAFVPETTQGKWLETDFLLVTRLRNYLSSESLDEGKYIVSFGGAHGTATRAIEVLLRDRHTLQEIARRLAKRPAAYQFVLRVSGMKHDMERGTIATKVDLMGDPVVLGDDQQMWRSARDTAKLNLDKWLVSSSKN